MASTAASSSAADSTSSELPLQQLPHSNHNEENNDNVPTTSTQKDQEEQLPVSNEMSPSLIRQAAADANMISLDESDNSFETVATKMADEVFTGEQSSQAVSISSTMTDALSNLATNNATALMPNSSLSMTVQAPAPLPIAAMPSPTVSLSSAIPALTTTQSLFKNMMLPEGIHNAYLGEVSGKLFVGNEDGIKKVCFIPDDSSKGASAVSNLQLPQTSPQNPPTLMPNMINLGASSPQQSLLLPANSFSAAVQQQRANPSVPHYLLLPGGGLLPVVKSPCGNMNMQQKQISAGNGLLQTVQPQPPPPPQQQQQQRQQVATVKVPIAPACSTTTLFPPGNAPPQPAVQPIQQQPIQQQQGVVSSLMLAQGTKLNQPGIITLPVTNTTVKSACSALIQPFQDANLPANLPTTFAATLQDNGSIVINTIPSAAAPTVTSVLPKTLCSNGKKKTTRKMKSVKPKGTTPTSG